MDLNWKNIWNNATFSASYRGGSSFKESDIKGLSFYSQVIISDENMW